MAVIRLDPIDNNTSDLLGDAAKRQGMLKHAFIIKQLEKVAAKEYEQQQKDSANGNNLG